MMLHFLCYLLTRFCCKLNWMALSWLGPQYKSLYQHTCRNVKLPVLCLVNEGTIYMIPKLSSILQAASRLFFRPRKVTTIDFSHQIYLPRIPISSRVGRPFTWARLYFSLLFLHVFSLFHPYTLLEAPFLLDPPLLFPL